MAVIVWKLISYWGKNTDEKSFTKLMKDCDLSSCIPYDGPEYFEESPISDIESYFTEDSIKKYITLGMLTAFMHRKCLSHFEFSVAKGIRCLNFSTYKRNFFILGK